jgi:hypothetical protein
MRALRRTARAAAAALGLGLAAPAATAVDLVGTWHVLVHYKDSASENPDLPRWDDRIWVFEREGERLRWTEYPIVVFTDDSGRFERTSRQYSRTLQHWEPNEKQLAQIRRGLEINERGSKSKALRRSAAGGWQSSAGSGAMGGNVLTYSEHWSIQDPDGQPVFRFEDSLSGPQAEGIEGVTEYRTTAVVSGDLLRGSYGRDGTRTGTFRLMRSGAVTEVTGSKSQAEMRARVSGVRVPDVAPLLVAPPTPETRARIRADLVRALEDPMRAQGLDPLAFRADFEAMADEILALREQGRSPDEIQTMLREGQIAAPSPP